MERFSVGNCELVITTGNITKWRVDGCKDAVVNAANELLLTGGGVSGAIHRAAGQKLVLACQELPFRAARSRCPVGEAVVTESFKLRVSKIVHTVGPYYYQGGEQAAIFSLDKSYRSVLSLARNQGICYVAFPAIACGSHGFPLEKAAEIAMKACKEESEGISQIHFILSSRQVYEVWVEAARAAGFLSLERRPFSKSWLCWKSF